MGTIGVGTLEALLTLRDNLNAGLDRSVKTLHEKAEVLKKTGQGLADAGSGLTTHVTLPLLAVSAVAAKVSTEINSSLGNIAALLTDIDGAELTAAVGEMKSGIQSLAVEVGKSTKDISGGLYEVISSLGYTEDSFVQLEMSAKAGRAGMASTQESFSFLSAVTKAYGDTSAESFKKVANLGFQAVNLGQTTFPQLASSIGGVTPQARLMGVSLEELFAVIATATGVTGNTSEVVTQMGSALTALMNPSTDMIGLFRELNVSSGEALIAEKGFVGALQEVSRYAKETGTPLADLLGRKEAVGLTAALAGEQAEDFGKKLAAMGDEAVASGKVLEDSLRKQQQVNEAGFAWDQFKVKVEIALQTLGDSLVPVLLEVARVFEPLLDLVKGMATFFGHAPKPIRLVITVLGLLAAAAGPVIYTIGKVYLAFASIAEVAPKVLVAIKSINLALVGIGIVAVAAGIAIGVLISKWREASEAAIRYSLESADLESRSLALARAIKGGRTTIGESAFKQASNDLSDLKASIESTQKTIDEINDNPYKTPASSARLAEAEKSLNSSKLAYDRLKDAISGVTVVSDQQALSVQAAAKASSGAAYELAGDAKKVAEELARGTDNAKELAAALSRGASASEITAIRKRHELEKQFLSDVQEYGLDAANALKSYRSANFDAAQAVDLLTSKSGNLGKELKDNIALLNRSIAVNVKLASVFRNGGADRDVTQKQAEAVRRADELHKRFLANVEKYGKKAAQAMQPLEIADYDAAKAAEKAEEVYEGLIEAVKNAGDLSGSEFIKQISDDIKKGASQLERDSKELIRRLGLKKELEQELELEVRLMSITGSDGLRAASASYLQFLRTLGEGSIAHGEQVIAGMDLIFRGYSDTVKQHLQDLADVDIVRRVRASGVTERDLYLSEREDILRIVQKGTGDVTLTWEQAYAYLSKISMEHWMSMMEGWQTLFGFIGGMFGGVAQQISSALGNIQSAYKQGQQLDTSGFGSAAGLSGAWSGIFAVIAIMYEVYKIVDAIIASHRAKKWSEATSVQVVSGDWSSPTYGNDPEDRSLSVTLRKMLQDITDAMGGFLLDLPEIVIRARADGKEFSAYVGGMFVGVFADATTAMEDAIALALTQATFAGLSQEFVTALQSSIGATMDELQDNLDVARNARRSRIGDSGAEYLDLSDRYRQQIEAERRLGIAIDDTVAARRRELDALKYSQLGIDTSTSDALRNLRSLSDGISEASESMRASNEHQIQELIRQIADLERRRGLPGGGGGVGPGSGPGGGGGGRQTGGGDDGGRDGETLTKEVDEWEAAIRRLQEQLEAARRELSSIPTALSDLEVNMGIFNALYKYLEGNTKYARQAHEYALMRVEIEFELIRQQLIAFGKFEQFQEMFNDALAAAREQAGEDLKPPRRGGGRGNTDNVQQFISDRQFELARRSMGEYAASLAELNREYDEQVRQAGRNSSAIAQLNALRAEEIRLLDQERRQAVQLDFRRFLGLSNGFDDLRDSAQGLIDSINDSPFGDERKARMIGRVMEDLNRQLDLMVRQVAAGLMGDLLGDLEKYGLLQQQQTSMRNALATLEHVIKVENYRREIEILRAQGRLAPAIMGMIDAAFNALANFDPATFIPANDNYNWRQTGDGYYTGRREDQNTTGTSGPSVDDSIARARELLDRYATEELDDLSQNLVKINDDFAGIIKALGRTPEVIERQNAAIASAIANFIEPITNVRKDIFYSADSSVSAIDQWTSIQSELALAQSRYNSGDLSVVKSIPDLAKTYMDIARRVLPHGSDRLAELEANLNQFLLGIESLTPEQVLGSTGNPMTISGLSQLANVNDKQLTTLDQIASTSARTVELLEGLTASGPWNSAAMVA